MAEIDAELIERAVRWCAEAGRQTTAAMVKAALGPLSWDELLAARALLADPPPVSPLGPFALADVARGAPADVAAERERAGSYKAESADAQQAEAPAAAPRSPPRTPPRGRKQARAPIVVRRASERTAAAPSPPTLPLLDALLLEEGRAVLERLIRRHGGKRARLTEALAAGWRRADARAVDGADLERVLEHHGMARGFATRERDELLHALRAAGGVRARAAETLGLDRSALEEALDRLGARGDAERLREQRRQELRGRGTLTQRSHLLLEETERLDDLGLLDEFAQDLAARLPDHVRALTASSPDSALDLLGRSLSLDPERIERLLQRTGLTLDALPAGAAARAPADRRPTPRASPGYAGRPRVAGARAAGRDRPRQGGRQGTSNDRGPRARPGAPDKRGPRGRPGGGPGGPRGGRPGGRPGKRPGSGARPPKRG